MYRKLTVEWAIDRELLVVESHGILGHSADLPWALHHSIIDSKYGDGVIIWASSVEQLKQNLDIIAEGSLPQEVAAAIGKIYRGIAADRIPYHF